jgi:hypothetical protein
VHVLDAVGLRQQVEQQRRGDVVGQVADYAQALCASAQGAEVGAQGIAVVQDQFADVRGGGLQRLQQVAIEFDGLQAAAGFQQRQGYRALAGADLDQSPGRVAARWRRGSSGSRVDREENSGRSACAGYGSCRGY